MDTSAIVEGDPLRHRGQSGQIDEAVRYLNSRARNNKLATYCS